MKSNYKKLGDYIRLVDERNTDGSVTRLLGVSIEKKFIESMLIPLARICRSIRLSGKGNLLMDL